MKNSSSKKTFAIVVSFVLNMLINGAIAYLLHLGKDYADTGFWVVVINMSITVYLITLLNAIFSGKRAANLIKNGVLEQTESEGFLSNISNRPFFFAFSVIGIVMPLISFVFGFIFVALGVTEMSVLGFTVFKATFGGIYGAFVTYLIFRRNQMK